MTDFLCPTCGPINEDDGLLVGPGDAVCCAFCGCPEEEMVPLVDAYNALLRKSSGPTPDKGLDFDRLVYEWFQESTIRHHIEPDGRHVAKRARFVAEKAVEWASPDSNVTGYRKLLQQLSDRARDNAVQQAKMWAQEARTQRAIVMEIGELVGCESDWEMVGAVREALAARQAQGAAEYSQGVCEDGAAILKDGQMMTIEEILAELRAPAPTEDVDDQQTALFHKHNGAED